EDQVKKSRRWSLKPETRWKEQERQEAGVSVYETRITPSSETAENIVQVAGFEDKDRRRVDLARREVVEDGGWRMEGGEEGGKKAAPRRKRGGERGETSLEHADQRLHLRGPLPHELLLREAPR